MNVEIPDGLYKDFLGFLDVAQASFTDEEILQMTDSEQSVIKWICSLIGKDTTKRFKTQEEYFVNIVKKFKEQTAEKDSAVVATDAVEKIQKD